jgi:hypothetical protein
MTSPPGLPGFHSAGSAATWKLRGRARNGPQPRTGWEVRGRSRDRGAATRRLTHRLRNRRYSGATHTLQQTRDRGPQGDRWGRSRGKPTNGRSRRATGKDPSAATDAPRRLLAQHRQGFAARLAEPMDGARPQRSRSELASEDAAVKGRAPDTPTSMADRMTALLAGRCAAVDQHRQGFAARLAEPMDGARPQRSRSELASEDAAVKGRAPDTPTSMADRMTALLAGRCAAVDWCGEKEGRRTCKLLVRPLRQPRGVSRAKWKWLLITT